MKVAIHLRPDPLCSPTVRCRAIGHGLQDLDRVRVQYLGRHEVDKDADLIIQPAFSATTALRYAVDNRKPYIILEEPHWRPDKEFCRSTASWD